MKKMQLVLGLVVFVNTVFGAVSTESSAALFVALGGYSSCKAGGPKGIGMYDSFNNFLDQIQRTNPDMSVHFIVACLPDSAPPKAQGEYITSQDPNKVISGDTFKIRDEIESFTNQTKDMPVYIVGHSYGGWMSLFLTSTLSPTVHLSGLFTLDPISTKCGPLEVITGSTYCKSAPKEFKNPEILKRAEHWENFYQTQDSWLHSSEMPESINHLMTYRGPHNQVDSDSRVWEVITSAVRAKLK